ncbi:helix-turn-helix transcriptional regulator [Natrinema amylolyticum]|uniref:helix-turn-helix transcriptional regulator n=1 Tax=Natrinema amylolyticum TaxID=2878679 RepID=UPI001CFA6F9B|nr:transcriptional regulator [Natrinema amylolyticum]
MAPDQSARASTLDAIQVFANSEHSVEVFKALTEGATTSKALTEQTEASRSTVARVLAEGESRGWIDSVGSQYKLTDRGEIMIDEFCEYLQTIEGVQQLGAAINWLPSPVYSIDFRHLSDANIITPTSSHPAGPYDHVAEMIRDANEMRSLVEVALRRFVKLIHNQSVGGKLDAEIVIKASWFDTLPAKPEQVPLWRTRAEKNGVWMYEGEVPINIHIFDESVAIWLGEEQGEEREVRGLLVTGNPTVVSWAESLYQDYRTEAKQVGPAILPKV